MLKFHCPEQWHHVLFQCKNCTLLTLGSCLIKKLLSRLVWTSYFILVNFCISYKCIEWLPKMTIGETTNLSSEKEKASAQGNMLIWLTLVVIFWIKLKIEIIESSQVTSLRSGWNKKWVIVSAGNNTRYPNLLVKINNSFFFFY